MNYELVMTEQQFISACKSMIAEHKHIDASEVYVVWLCKILQNNKALLSTTVPDTTYYEITYDGDKKKFYFDEYTKTCNFNFAKTFESVEDIIGQGD